MVSTSISNTAVAEQSRVGAYLVKAPDKSIVVELERWSRMNWIAGILYTPLILNAVQKIYV
jgi:hypothetical protein